MPEVLEMQLNVVTTNLVGGKKKRLHPHFACFLVIFLIDFDRFLVSLHPFLMNAASMPLEVPCCHLVDRGCQGLE
jgi:hypothetical protein